MRMLFHLSCFAAVIGLLSLVSGCESTTSKTPAEISDSPPSDDHDDEHEGPHHGHVIELGRKHEYHAELVDDDEQESVTVYILDKNLKELPIDAKSITMNLTDLGVPKTFELAPVDASGGMTSRFDGTDKSLFVALHKHEATGKLNVTINGTPYSGAVEHHDHDH